MNQTSGFFALLSVGFLYSITAIFMRELSPEFTGYQQVIYRNLLAGIVLLPFTGEFSILFVQSRKTTAMIVVASLCYPIVLTLFTYGVLYGTIAGTILGLYFASTTASILFGKLVFGERLRAQTLIGIMLAMTGLGLHTTSGMSGTSVDPGILLGAAGGVLQSIANLIRKRVSTAALRLPMVALQSWFSVPLILLVAMMQHEPLVPTASASLWAWMFVYALLQIGFVYLLIYGFENFPLNLGHVVLASELLFGALVGIIFYKELLTALEISGVALTAIKLRVVRR